MDQLLVIPGTFVLLIFLFKRELLFQKSSMQLIWVASGLLFGLAIFFVRAQIGGSLMKMLAMPLLTIVLFSAIKYVFFLIYKRNPEDTFWSIDWNQMPDGLFNFFFWVLAVALPTILVFKLL
jgi:hypothetical protein